MDMMDAGFWDERYAGAEQLFSGAPNGVLVTEVTDMTPGRALDVGCGEGGDALWLAEKGWQVTAVDVSQVALDRAAARDVAGRVRWTQADLGTSAASGVFDLVSAQYFPAVRQRDHATIRGLLAAVAPGGILLIVGHDFADLPPREELDFDPDDFYQPAEIADLLGDEWDVEINETRARTAPAPAGTRHVSDTVLRARRAR
ncbi:class I SAM-dependent methyltransferase [Rhodococcus triatomae]|nr:type 12 methyltransferase [Rhodococcus triatomae BKS 15-14]